MKTCYHCGDDIKELEVLHDQQHFCCNACVMVYDLLKGSELADFYSYEKAAGVKPKKQNAHQFLFLDEPEIRKKFIQYEDENHLKINLYLPDIHCYSCIYLLENSNKLHPGIKHVMVHFTKKEAVFSLDPKLIKLSELANLLVKIGYEPNFGNRNNGKAKVNRQFLYKIGVAAFAFGNVMLWSVPEYGGLGTENSTFRNFSAILSLIVSIPVLFYSARDYFISAYKSLKIKQLNLDVPISIGILALYLQSLWSILNREGAGYMDSFTGFIFFLLIGKWFQNWSYQSLSFERDYKSYFPVAVTRIEDEFEKIVEIDHIEEGDELLIRNEEIIPCDSILLSQEADIDFSFVTGESAVVRKKYGDFIYAGGKLIGTPIHLKVKHKTQRSHLTSLWNTSNDGEVKKKEKSYQDKVSVYFLAVVLMLSLVAGISWYFIDKSQITHVIVSILIVTCPCALALSAPFTYGNTSRLLGRRGLYLKNTGVIETMNGVTDIVFDKTGTLTESEQQAKISYVQEIDEPLRAAILKLANASLHPICLGLKQTLRENTYSNHIQLSDFSEYIGKGVEAIATHQNQSWKIQIGSASFVAINEDQTDENSAFITVDSLLIAKVHLSSVYRSGIKKTIHKLKPYRLHVLSGDQPRERDFLERLFSKNAVIRFQQTPQDKLAYIERLQLSNRKVMMIGDGLNDAGALNQANVGVAVSENSFRFTPASDAIIASESIRKLPELLKTAKRAKTILAVCLTFSVCYNVVGLSFAFTGQMTPLVAAILMPISSVTVVLISTFLVLLLGRKG